MTAAMPVMTGDEILALMEREFPPIAGMGLRILALDERNIHVVWPGDERLLRPGGTISGPAMMTLADTAVYFLVLAQIGPQSMTVTTNLNINFLRKPAHGELHAEARLLKLGSRLAVGDVTLYSSAAPEVLAAQATVTYSIPPTK